SGADSGKSVPNTILTPSLRIRISAKVASTCVRWSRTYSVRSSVISSSMPNSAVSTMAPSTPSTNEPVSATSQAAMNAPTMYSDPCARLIMSITPNTSVSPAASRNSISPNCSPLSSCSMISSVGMRAAWAARSGLHRASADVGVAVILQDRCVEGLVDQPALAVGADRAHVVVLDRVLIGVELERPAHRIELGRLQCLAQRFAIVELALDVAHRRVDQ